MIRPPRRPARRRDDRGSQILEFAAYVPLFLLMAVIALEVFFSFVAVEQAENAARIGARVAEQTGPANAVGAVQNALPPWMDDADIRTGYTDDRGVFAEVAISVPVVFDIASLDYTVTRRVDMAL
ncbi:TadE family protein [Actinorugispora endophytica]|uniref:TadE-like protein n=1 Tax=Actinorugispora endophytica TaxID=1605990 RepID=A0A4R6UV14_9ACTN|nr:TadE family protein [Actinorugispora endophytica]TDQ49255.1 TadE-like protein [Actinorugispora endophytica]